MRLKVITIADRGVPNKERLHLSALVDANLVNYAIFDTVRMGDGSVIASIPRHAYWFTPSLVRAGDNVVVYTGPGVATKNARANGGTDYFFFWGLKQTIWSDPKSCAVVLEVADWATSP